MLNTLPEANIAPEDMPFQKETSIPTIYFQVLLLLVSGRVSTFLHHLWNNKMASRKPTLLVHAGGAKLACHTKKLDLKKRELWKNSIWGKTELLPFLP